MKNDAEEKKVALVLSGCGVFDGSEIHEAVCAILNIKKCGAKISFFAPDIFQSDVVNHATHTATAEKRSVLAESARISRGEISPLSQFDAKKFDAIIFAGGFGAAKNLSSFAREGAACKVNPDVERAIKTSLKEGVKLGFLCISPVIAAKVIGGGVRLTIGSDAATAEALEKMGAKHVECPPTDFVKDENFGVYSTPAYMSAADIVEMNQGVEKMIIDILK